MAPAPTFPTADAHKPGKAQRHSDERERLLAHRQGLHRASGAALHCQADLVEQNRNLKADNLELTAALHTTNQAFDTSHALNHAAWLDQDDTNRNLKAENTKLAATVADMDNTFHAFFYDSQAAWRTQQCQVELLEAQKASLLEDLATANAKTGARVERFFTEVVPAAAVTASLALLGAAEAGLEAAARATTAPLLTPSPTSSPSMPVRSLRWGVHWAYGAAGAVVGTSQALLGAFWG